MTDMIPQNVEWRILNVAGILRTGCVETCVGTHHRTPFHLPSATAHLYVKHYSYIYTRKDVYHYIYSLKEIDILIEHGDKNQALLLWHRDGADGKLQDAHFIWCLALIMQHWVCPTLRSTHVSSSCHMSSIFPHRFVFVDSENLLSTKHPFITFDLQIVAIFSVDWPSKKLKLKTINYLAVW